MKPLSFRDFNVVYQDCARVVLKHWTTEMQVHVARHCYGWSPGLFDFNNYVRVSAKRFYKAYESFAAIGSGRTICDVGGQMGVFPVTLRKLGYDVTMTEALQYYGELFKEFFACIREQGVKIADYDPFEPSARLSGKFDVLTVMAVIEHYPHSLKYFMENVIALMKPDGRIYIEVPNIAYFPKRIRLLLGRTPESEIQDIFRSEVPFIGHHHEFTISELRDLARLTGLSVLTENFYNYSISGQPFLQRLLRYAGQLPAFALLKTSRECLAVWCKLNDEQSSRPKA
jgi:2-polyprenyl-3-methyl-5-hydroxy-6-metoxy-1,4-benzoquinol methylase